MLQQIMRMWRLTAWARGLSIVSAIVGAGAASGCAGPPAQVPLSHVDRVIEDVTAIVEGMVQAHSGPSGIAQIPDIRSFSPRS